MTFTLLQRAIVACGALALLSTGAQAAEPVRIGLIAPFSGSFADYGKQTQSGFKGIADSFK
jgi:branched-chain amino acid transport system substrate-binding protein